MQPPNADSEAAYGERLHELAEAVGSVVLVCNGEPEGDLLHAD
jgi:hypothetical protein